MTEPSSLPVTQHPQALSRPTQAVRSAIVALPYLVTAAKFLAAWAWLGSWQLKAAMVALALARPFIGRTFPGWRERATAVARTGAWLLTGEFLKAALAAWSRA